MRDDLLGPLRFRSARSHSRMNIEDSKEPFARQRGVIPHPSSFILGIVDD
jgi:hypothetical protein